MQSDPTYWQRVGAHFDRKDERDLNYLSSGDGLIVHHHTGLFPDGRDLAPRDEQEILRALWHSEHRMVRFAAELLAIRPGMRGLDCGCGRGGSSLMFARDYGAEMFGITISSAQAAFAERAAAALELSGQARFALENLHDHARPDGAYDFVFACESTEYMDRPALFAEWRRVLRPGGVALAIVLTYVPSRLPEVARELALLNEYYVARAGSLASFLDGARQEGLALDDLVHLERETLPYWRLRLRSGHRSGTEPWLIHGLETGGFHFSAIRFRKPE
jgi:cyclopropane fatty-acyl-phospholipid synthase-like methyltransferase